MSQSGGVSRRTAPLTPARALPLVLLATAAGALLATAKYGVGLTPDSVVYVAGARSLAAGRGYSDGGRAITDFPPGYSWALSLLDRTGLDAIDAARVLGVVTFLVTVTLGYLLLRRHTRTPGVLITGTVVIGCSAVLLNIYTNALSEHLFVIAVLLFVFTTERLIDEPRRPLLLAALVALVWAAFYLRYIGVVLAAVGALVILLAEWPRGRVQAVARGAVVGALGLSAPLLWMARNRDTGSGTFGHRSASSASPVTNLTRVRDELSEWVVTDRAPVALGTLLLLLALVVAVAFVIRHRSRLRPPADWKAMLPLALLIGVYVTYLVASASLVAFAAINTRLMIPVFVPIVVVVAWAYEYARDNLERESSRRALAALALVWVGVNVVWFGARAVRLGHDGAGAYSTARYHDSEILDDVENLDFSIPTFSNDVPAISLFADEKAIPSVARTFFQSAEQTGRLPAFVQRVACEGRVRLVWLLPNPRPYLYEPDELAEVLRLEVVTRRRDGVIYDVRPLAGSPACRAAP